MNTRLFGKKERKKKKRRVKKGDPWHCALQPKKGVLKKKIRAKKGCKKNALLKKKATRKKLILKIFNIYIYVFGLIIQFHPSDKKRHHKKYSLKKTNGKKSANEGRKKKMKGNALYFKSIFRRPSFW